MAQRRQSDDGAGCAALLVISVVVVVVYFAATWPYYVGVWVAEKAGAADPSDARTIVGVLFQVGYVVSVLSVLAGLLVRRHELKGHAAAAEVALAHQREREAEVARWEAAVRRHKDELATIDRVLRVMTRFSEGIDGATFPNWPDQLERGERVLGFGAAWYCAPRVAHRGGPKVQTEVESGRYLITDRHVRFRSEGRSEIWALNRVSGLQRETTAQRARFLLVLTGRKILSGLSVRTGLPSEVLDAQLNWARSYPQPPEPAIARLKAVHEESARELAQAQRQLQRSRSQVTETTGAPRTA